jgi:hypothetical protein
MAKPGPMVHLRPKVGSAMLASLSLEGRLVPTLVSVRAYASGQGRLEKCAEK